MQERQKFREYLDEIIDTALDCQEDLHEKLPLIPIVLRLKSIYQPHGKLGTAILTSLMQTLHGNFEQMIAKEVEKSRNKVLKMQLLAPVQTLDFHDDKNHLNVLL